MGRVFGPELMWNVCRLSADRGYRHFLLGGNDGVAPQLAQSLTQRIPNLRIVGTYTPPFRPLQPAELAHLEEQFAELRPDICWIGLSTPKQERFMAAHLGRLQTTLMVGVGAAFDYHTGRIADAPDWVKRSGLQWLHRLAQDPRRLWKRYLVNNPKFLHAITLQLTGLRQYRLDPDPIISRVA
jgi:N-acetylglucosaminyldiphosphoundecaprenol N-acetyl-beta-D-mannosaminyltransferase